METVAMYWEPRIKTYGFQVVKGLTLLKYVLSADKAMQWERALVRPGVYEDRFSLFCAQLNKASDLDLLLLCRPEQGSALDRHIEAEIPAAADRRRVISPVELLFFQGPHFGDRFGIADFTYKALKEQSDLLLAAVFACASVHLILPEGAADKTKTMLDAAFRIPS